MSTALLSGRSVLLSGAAALLATEVHAARPDDAVSCALVMAVDVASSINGEHWWLQRKGYVNAFLMPEVIPRCIDTIWSGGENNAVQGTERRIQ